MADQHHHADGRAPRPDDHHRGHDDQGHGHDEHAHDEHAHDGHGHDGHRHSHDGHGHSHDGHGHSHDGHGHDGHAHQIAADADRRWLATALALIGVFLAGEVVVGLLAGSLALLSDAAHMLTDAGAIVLALVAMRLAARPPRGGYTYGLKRAEIMSALVNGVTMLGLAVWLGIEAVRRLIDPPQVHGLAVLLTAAVGVVVNVLAAQAIGRANRTSLNVRGAYLHILTDLYAFLATGAAGAVMLATGFTRADGIATLVVVALMLRAGAALVVECTRIFLEAAPPDLDLARLGADLADLTGVTEVHDLHVWQITSGQPALSAHVMVASDHDCHRVRAGIEQVLRERYRIGHSTVQVDHEPTPARTAVTTATAPARCRTAGGVGGHRCEPHGERYRSAAAGSD